MKPAFEKYSDGLVPAIVQDAATHRVLMLGFVSEESWYQTLETKQVTFFSRSRNALWTKGETSGNFLDLVSWSLDCDADTLLIKAKPVGPVCHTGADTCFNEENLKSPLQFLSTLEAIIAERKANPQAESYTSKLMARGINKMAQKLGEEAVELVIEAKDEDSELFLGEAADLLFHYLILLQAKGFQLHDVVNVLERRHRKKG